jgi:hypothetical protein
MKHADLFRHSMLAIALCSLTGIAVAQTTPQPMTSPSATTPPATTAPAATTPPPAGSTVRMPSRSEPADSAFSKLDSAKRGYLQKSDVAGLEGISFETADINKDGRLTQEEFAKVWTTK